MSSSVQTETTRTPIARWVALAAITTAALMVVLDASGITIALPQMQQALGLSDAARGWAVTAYAVAFGGLLLLGGRIGDVAGRKRVLLVSLSGFAAASLLGGFAQSPEVLIAARALQGVFAAALAPAALSLVAVTFTEPRERARAFAIFAATQGSGGAIGLLLGGALTETLGWRWSMLINVPIALVALALGLPTILGARARAGGRLDIPGAVLATLGAAALVGALSVASEPGGWTSPTPFGFLVAAALLIGAFAWRQRRASDPLLPGRIVADRTRGGAYLMAGFLGAGMFGMFLLLPYFLQERLALSPLLTGMVIVPFSVALVLASLLVPSLVRRMSEKTVLAVGIVIATIAMAGLAIAVALPDPLGAILVATTVMGAGIGLVFAPLNGSVVAGVDAGDVGVASAMFSVSQQLGGAVGVALLNGIAIASAGMAHSTLDGIAPDALRLAFLVATVLYAISAAIALVVIPSSTTPRRTRGADADAGTQGSVRSPSTRSSPCDGRERVMTDATTSRLWQPLGLGAANLRNRLVLSPMTRRRAAADGTPTPLMVEYYAQRSGFGLVVTEGIFPSSEGRAYLHQPGLVDDAHERGWAAVTQASHAHGTPIFAQLMHAGRVTSPEITGTRTILAPSALPFEDHHGHHSAHTTTAATSDDIAQLIQAHVDAARRALRAGFDGIELHAANGYLLQQFLAPSTNHRADDHGGTPSRRARFVVDVAEAVADAIGADRVGIRVSPGANVQGALELDEQDVSETYAALLDGLRGRSLAYVSVIHPEIDGALVQGLRRASGTPLIANTGFSAVTDRSTATSLVDAGHADAVAVGRAAIANPDLPDRWRADRPEAVPDPATFYTGGATGYTEHPADDRERRPR